jgi:DNA-binding LacI/PurR family transcriptional regulator
MSIRELRKLYNVSQPTVVKALQELIDEGVLIPKAGIGTFVNTKSNIPFSNLYQEKVKQIALVIATGKLVHYDYLYQRIIAGIFTVLSARGAVPQLLTPMELDSSFEKVVASLGFDGVLWVNPDDECVPAAYSIDESIIPLVSAVFRRHDYPSKNNVSVDFFQAGCLVGDKMFKAGHRRILHISNDTRASDRVIAGAKSVYEKNGILLGDEFFIVGGEKVIDEIDVMLKVGFEFTAIYADGNFCLPLQSLLSERGVNIPEDVELVTVEDACSVLLDSNLTMVRPPLEKMGRLAAEMLLLLINGESVDERKVVLDWNFFER